MGIYWLKFKDRTHGCVEADTEQVARVAGRLAKGVDVIECDTLPYPADPRLTRKKYKDKNGREYTTPSFCYEPQKCKGKTSCPQGLSCVE